MFKQAFGNIRVNVPGESPGKRWQRLRRLAMLARQQTGLSDEQLDRLEASSQANQSRVSLASALVYADLLARKLRCKPIDVLLYVYPEIDSPAFQRGAQEE